MTSTDGDAVPAETIVRDLEAGAAFRPGPPAVGRALVDTGLFVETDGGLALAPPYRPHTSYFRRQAQRLATALRLAAETVPPAVPADVRRGAALFNAGLFFACHEYFEDVWRDSVPPAREFYHGLVQAAAGCYHAEKGNPHGAAVLLGKAVDKLTAYRPAYLGVDVAVLIVSLGPVREAARTGPGRPGARTPFTGSRPVIRFVPGPDANDISGRASRPRLIDYAGDVLAHAAGMTPRPEAPSTSGLPRGRPMDQLSLLPDEVPAPIGGRVYVGTCSWAEKSFVKSDFYPPGVRSASDRLRYYAGRFPTVEIDASYFALLPPAYSRRWAEETPPGFVMNAKAFGLFTGHAASIQRLPPGFAGLLPRRLRDVPEIRLRDVPEEFQNACWDAYRAFLAPLADAGRLGYVLFQLPPGTRYAPSVVDDMARWRRELDGRQVAVEFRHRDWARHPEVFDELKRLGFAYVIVDLPDLPWLMPPVETVTADVAVIRFHGRNREGWARPKATTDQRYDYAYSADELRHWAGVAQRVGGQTARLYAMFNNHVGGAMARDAQALASLLGVGE